MSWIISIAVIIAGIIFIAKPDGWVANKNKNLTAKGKPELTEKQIHKERKRARVFGVLFVVLGAIILLCEYLLLLI